MKKASEISPAAIETVLQVLTCIDNLTFTEIILAASLPDTVVKEVLQHLADQGKAFKYQNIRPNLSTYSIILKTLNSDAAQGREQANQSA